MLRRTRGVCQRKVEAPTTTHINHFQQHDTHREGDGVCPPARAQRAAKEIFDRKDEGWERTCRFLLSHFDMMDTRPPGRGCEV
jgi:hypothetical protein